MCSSAETPTPSGWLPFARLLELLRVAEQHEAVRGLRHGEHVGERHLPGFVDEQHVDRRRESARAQSHAVPPTTFASPDLKRRERVVVVCEST